MIDTHTHIYLAEFNNDRETIIQNSKNNGVQRLYIPNIDQSSIGPMMNLCKMHPDYCFPMIGLHPGSVNSNYKNELQIIEEWLSREKFHAIGEVGLDYYWDTTYSEEQQIVFSAQIELALQNTLPIVIHIRNAFNDVFKILETFQELPKGIFHCFSGNLEQAQKAIRMGFKLGIGGVITFNNSSLQRIVKTIGLDHLVLETDAPYLAPVPYRGKRNEPSYLHYISEKIAAITQTSVEDVIKITTDNALELFNTK